MKFEKTNSLLQVFILIVFAAGLLLYSFLGLYTRYWADDWCYVRDVKSLGLIGMLNGYNNITYYASNRISLGMATYFLQWLGLAGVQLLPFFLIAGCLFAFILILINLDKLLQANIQKLQIFTIASGVIFFTIYLAPNQFQSIFWRAASLPYTAALFGCLLIFSLLTAQMRGSSQSKWINFIIGPLTLFSAMFSESGAVFIFSALVLMLIAAYSAKAKHQPWAQRSLPAVWIALVFNLIAIGILVSSPAIALRTVNYPDRPSIWLVPLTSLRFSAEFGILSLAGLILPHLMLGLLFFSLPLLHKSGYHVSIKQVFMAGAVLTVAGWLLMAANQAPTIYLENGPPHPRALIMSRFVFTLIVSGWAYLAGMFCSGKLPQNLSRGFGRVLVLISIVYFSRCVWLESRQLAGFAQRAQIWDQREAEIQAAVKNGVTILHVRAIDGSGMDHTRDLKEDPKFWLNACAASYYGLSGIIADQK